MMCQAQQQDKVVDTYLLYKMQMFKITHFQSLTLNTVMMSQHRI